MSNVAKSIFFFGIYLIFLGAILIVIPNVLLSLFTIPITNEVWIRIVGMLLLYMGYYYIRAARDEEGMTKFYRWTVHCRSLVIVFLITFVVLAYVKPIIILFGVIDLAAAIWTGMALRSSVN